MGSKSLRASRLQPLVVAVLATAIAACDTPRPSPSATPAGPASSAAPTKVPGDLALEACDPEGLLPCEHQALVLHDPVAATGLALTYSTEWADGRLDRPSWNADALGLGGWSLNVLHRYDAERGILLAGDGSWRLAAAVDIGDGERAVPAFDGLQYFVFDAAWRHVRTIESMTGATLLTIGYDDAGRVRDVRGAGAGSPVELTVDRDATGNVSLFGPGRTTTAIVTDREGRLIAISRPDGTFLQLDSGDFGLVASWSVTGRGTFRYEWDDAGRLRVATDPDAVSRELAFEGSNGAVSVSVRDANDGVATFRSERAGDVLRRTFTDTDGTVTQLETNPDGATRLVEADGTVTTAGAIPHPRWGPAAPVVTPIVETRPDGTEYRVEATTTMATGSPEPAGGAWETVTTIAGQRWVDAYDPASRVLTSTDPEGRTSSQRFDVDARVTEQRLAGQPVVAFAYSPEGILTSRTVGEGASAATTLYTYDREAGEVLVNRADGTSVQGRFDAFGNLRRAWTAEENVALALDSARAVQELRPGSHPATAFGYSEAGRPTAFIPPAVGDDAWYELTTYTAAGQVATIGDGSGPSIELEYDQAGRAASWAFDRGTSTTTYGAQSGLLDATAAPGGVTTSFTYDGWVRTGIAWAGPVAGDVRLEINSLLQATSQTVNGANRIDYGYDDSGLLTSIGDLVIDRDPQTGLPIRSTLGGLVTSSTYDAAGRLVGSSTTSAGQTVVDVRYVRDAAGRVVQIERTDGNDPTATVTFGYDGTGRLMSFQRDGVTTRYVYDATGNRSSTDPGTGSITTASFDDRDRILAQDEETFRHSPDGPLLEREGAGGRTTYDFDDLGALRAVTLPGGPTIEYVVDAGGRRIGRKVDGALTEGYLYSVDDTIAALTDGTGRVVARFAYDDQGRLALVQRDGRDLLVVTDQLGSPIALLDRATGNVVEQISYDAWGNVLDGSPSDLLPFGFAGGLVDPDTGLVHFGLRDYDPTTGRWTAPDPLRYVGGDINLYRYALGDPVNLVDPTGTTACTTRACGTAAAGGVQLLRPQPTGGRRGTAGTGGSTGGGKTAGGGSRTGGGKGAYGDAGPKNISPPSGSAPAGSAAAPRGAAPTGPASSPPPSSPSRPPAAAPAAPPASPPASPPSGTTVCFSGPCVGPDGVTGAAPGNNAELGGCIGICFPLGDGMGGCIGVCGGNSDRGGFICIIACGYGEPHLITGDGGDVDLQVAGEFVVARSSDSSLEIQVRFETPEAVTTVTRGTAVAMLVGGDRVGFYADSSRPLVINGEAIDRADYAVTLPGGGVVERHGTLATVTWPDGSLLSVSVYARFVNFGFSPSAAVGPSMVGIVGSNDGNRANDLTTRDGTVIDPEAPGFLDLLHDRFADSWRISQDESLFDYLDGESTATFQRPEIPTEHVTVANLDAQTRARAEALCRAAGVQADPILSDCILDVGLTGDPAYAASAATANEAQERANAEPLDLGTAVEREQPISGNLVSGAVDRYHFTAAAGDIVYLDADSSCGPNVDWRLLRPDGGLVTFADACVDLGRRELPVAGEWRIEVYSDDGSAGPYAFRIQPAPQPQERTIAPGQSAAGATTTAGEWHRYTLTAAAGQVVYLDATGDCASPMSWRVVRPNGGLVAFDIVCNDLGRRVFDEAGDWAIEVYADGTETGAYAFEVIDVPAARETAVTLGETISDATGRVGEWHRYRFTAKEGQVLYADAIGACQPGLSWRLLRPDGGLTTFQTTCVDLGRRVLDQAGDWVFEIYGDASASGAYSFRLIGVPPVRVRPIELGGSARDTIDEVGEWHRYTLSATAGQQIVIDAEGDCVADLYWRLLRPDGGLTTFATTCTDSDARTLDEAGDWVIEVHSDTMATGAYAFTVKAAP